MSLFGGRANPPAPIQTSTPLFGGTPAATTQPAAGGLFGTATPAASSQAPPTLNLFGATSGTPQSAATGSSLFGGALNTPNNTTSTPASAPSLFGNATPSAPTSGGLFGATSTPAATTGGGLNLGGATTSAPATGGLFGSAAAPATGGGGGLFGAAASSAPSGGALFGAAAAPTGLAGVGGTATNTVSSTTGGGNFGNTTQSTKPSLFTASAAPATNQQTNAGTSFFGNTTNTNGAQQAVKIEWHNLAPYHKFHELNDPIRAEVEAAERYILAEIQRSEGLAAAFPEHREMVLSISADAELMERKLMTTNSFLQSDVATLEQLVKNQKLDDQHASLSVRTLDLLRLPHAARALQTAQYPSSMNPQQQQQASFMPLPTSSSATATSELDITTNAGMINYFNRNATEMEGKFKLFVESVSEVEASLRSVETQAMAVVRERRAIDGVKKDGDGRQDSRKLIGTLRGFYDALNDVSVRVVDGKEGLRELKAASSSQHQQNMGSSFRRI